ncbi:MAG TPA: hypothetical protein VFO57_10050 [Burkholderiales bacterium]|nr:hypothetical protein [Burkholderiales bacterium]
MTTFEQWRSPSSRMTAAGTGHKPRKYDIRVVDQFYAYCQAIAHTEKHRDEARCRSHGAARRSIWTMLVTASFMFYYLMDRVAQAVSLF